MSAQTVNTIAHLFRICIESVSVDTHLGGAAYVWDMRERPDALMSSILSSATVTVNGAYIMWRHAGWSADWSSLPFSINFHLSHCATLGFFSFHVTQLKALMWALKHAEQYSNMYILYPKLWGVMILTQIGELIENIKIKHGIGILFFLK